MMVAVRKVDRIVEKSVFLIPKRQSLDAVDVDGRGNVDEMLEEFAGHVFVGGILARQLERNRQHVQAIHSHPAGAVGLFEMASRGQRLRTVKDSDVVKAEKTA